MNDSQSKTTDHVDRGADETDPRCAMCGEPVLTDSPTCISCGELLTVRRRLTADEERAELMLRTKREIEGLSACWVLFGCLGLIFSLAFIISFDQLLWVPEETQLYSAAWILVGSGWTGAGFRSSGKRIRWIKTGLTSTYAASGLVILTPGPFTILIVALNVYMIVRTQRVLRNLRDLAAFGLQFPE